MYVSTCVEEEPLTVSFFSFSCILVRSTRAAPPIHSSAPAHGAELEVKPTYVRIIIRMTHARNIIRTFAENIKTDWTLAGFRRIESYTREKSVGIHLAEIQIEEEERNRCRMFNPRMLKNLPSHISI
jgi:hypothetical protein